MDNQNIERKSKLLKGESIDELNTFSGLKNVSENGLTLLQKEDPLLFHLMEKEYWRQNNSLALVASCSTAHPSVLACEGSYTSNVTAEGYPGKRFHAGCEYVDQFEQLAIDRACKVFKAKYANVQPHTASTANQIVTSCLLSPGDTLMGLDLNSGGHLSHGAKVNISGKFYNSISYGLDEEANIDFDNVRKLAHEHRPKLIICGTTSYPRSIDFRKFREIADEVGAYLLADITHIAGLVIAGLHQNPIDIAHFTTTCTHKQLYGPRGGLILMGKEWKDPRPNGKGTLSGMIQRGLFPFTQGAPIINKIVAKARALGRADTQEFKDLAQRIVNLSQSMAKTFVEKGARVISGGTDNHIVIIDVLTSFGVTGIVAEKALEECNIIVNKNNIPGDTKGHHISSGIRIGTNSLACREVDSKGIERISNLIFKVLKEVKVQDEKEYELDPKFVKSIQEEVLGICKSYPLPNY